MQHSSAYCKILYKNKWFENAPKRVNFSKFSSVEGMCTPLLTILGPVTKAPYASTTIFFLFRKKFARVK